MSYNGGIMLNCIQLEIRILHIATFVGCLFLADYAFANSFGTGRFGSQPLTLHIKEVGGPGRTPLQVRACFPGSVDLKMIC